MPKRGDDRDEADVRALGGAVTAVTIAIRSSLVALVGAAVLAAGATAAAPAQGQNAFDLFDADAAGHSWNNSYLLSKLSDQVYESSVGATGWVSFQQRFRQKVGAWARSSEELRFDFVRSSSTGTEVAVLTDSESVIVVFRGTESSSLYTVMTDWTTDGSFLLQAAPTSWGAGVRVHAGFRGAMSSVFATLRTLVNARRAGTKRVWVTGHSLGGALATLFAYRLRKDSTIPVQGVHTYGQPRVGNYYWRVRYSAILGASTHRWGHSGDPVVHLPPGAAPGQKLTGYYHVGRLNKILPNGSVVLNGAETLSPVALANHSSYTTRIFNRLAPGTRSLMPTPAS